MSEELLARHCAPTLIIPKTIVNETQNQFWSPVAHFLSSAYLLSPESASPL